MVTNRIIFYASRVQPNPDEIDYWVDLVENPYGGVIKYYNGTDWVKLNTGGTTDLSNYYTKSQVNELLNGKADTEDVDSKVDDEEVKDVIKDLIFRVADPNNVSLVLLKYDDTTEVVTIPVATESSAGIVTSDDFNNFVKQHQLQELHTEMIDLFADIRAKYQKRLIAGKNIHIDYDTSVISATGDLSVEWDMILNKPDFKDVATSGDYNDLTNKLQAGKGITITEDNTINADIDTTEFSEQVADLNRKIQAEATTRENADNTLQTNIDNEADAREAADNTLQSNINSEATARQQADTTLQNNIDTEVSDRQEAVTAEQNRATAAEKKLQDNINSTSTTLQNAITTEQNRAETAEQTIATNLQNEIDRSTQQDTAHTNAINKEIQDRTQAIATEVTDRNAAIKVETDRAIAAEEALYTKITDHTTEVNAALALKADKSDTYTKAQVDAKLSGAYKVKGSSTFEALPTEGNIVGDVYNITNSFDLDGDHYDAGTNVVWTDEGWDPLSGSFDTTAIEGSIQAVEDKVNQEILDRTNADTAITNNLTSVTSRVSVTETKLDTLNADEDTTGSISNILKQAKAYTDTEVTTESTRAQAAEQQLTADLATEVTRAQGAESANKTAIDNEVTRATGIETALREDVDNLADTKVDKVSGKGLSTNDYTTAEKDKLADIEDNANNYTLPNATTTTLGGIIVGDRLSIDANGKLTATYTYTLPTATDTVLGGVKIGSNITNTSGTISLTKANVVSALGVDPTTTYVKKAGDTMTGTLTSASTAGSIVFKGVENNDITNIYTNNATLGNDTNLNAIRNGLRFNWYTTYWYIGNIRGSGEGSDGFGVANEENKLYLQVTKTGTIAPTFTSTVATGTAPIKVTSTTVCNNLNADMLDGYHASDLAKGLNQINTNNYSSTPSWILLASLTVTNISASSFGQHYISLAVSGRPSSGVLTVIYKIEYGEPFLEMYSNSIILNYRTFIGYVLKDGSDYTVQIYAFSEVYHGLRYSVLSASSPANGTSNWVINNEVVTKLPSNPYYIAHLVTQEETDWYGVSWSETSSNPDCMRIGNMNMHRTLPIQSAMKPFAFQTNAMYKDTFVPLAENFENSFYGHSSNTITVQVNDEVNVMIRIPEFWYIDDYVPSTKTHNLKICSHAKAGWNHHKEAYVAAYELYNLNNRAASRCGVVPTVNFNRTAGRTWARANNSDESKWNLYTYEEHRAICHLFLVEYATRNSQKAVNTSLTAEGFRQGGLGEGCTTGTATINGATTYAFIPTGSSDSLGYGSGEVTVTIQQTDASGNNTSTITRKCNRYRGIENPFGHIWKHTDDVISIYQSSYRIWYKSEKPSQFALNKNSSYRALTAAPPVDGYKSEIKATPNCDFFATSVTNGSASTYWCDWNSDNTDTSEHCLLIGGDSGIGGWAGLFYLYSYNGVGISWASTGSRLTYLPWAE